MRPALGRGDHHGRDHDDLVALANRRHEAFFLPPPSRSPLRRRHIQFSKEPQSGEAEDRLLKHHLQLFHIEPSVEEDQDEKATDPSPSQTPDSGGPDRLVLDPPSSTDPTGPPHPDIALNHFAHLAQCHPACPDLVSTWSAAKFRSKKGSGTSSGWNAGREETSTDRKEGFPCTGGG